jgi:hypothetical protein
MEIKDKKPEGYINNAVNFREKVFTEIAGEGADQVWLKASLKDVKRAVIINSAPRSGSSLLFAILRKISQFYSLSGEDVPFYKLNGISKDASLSDDIPVGFEGPGACTFGMSRDFLSDFSLANSGNDIFKSDRLLNQYINDLALRFPLQWPQVNFSYDVFINLARLAFNNYRTAHKGFLKEEFYLELLLLLKREYKVINPYYYDIPVSMVRRRFGGVKIPSGPPNPVIMIEEPPFILLSPGKKVNSLDLSGKTLLLKSSINSYRMRFIERLLPHADIKIIYLIRNPAASINGLYDGWLHRGFFSHNLKETGFKMLKISGYSDKFDWGKWWWNYDLPGGWQDYTRSKLEEVCAFQWHAANSRIQEYLHKSRKKYCLVRHENIVRSLGSRKQEIGSILDFVGIERRAMEQLGLDNLSVVQATKAPQPYRWKKRKSLLAPILNSPEIGKMAGLLGYDKKNIKEWL